MDTKLSIPRDPTKKEFNDFSKLDNNQLFDKLIDDINGWGWFQKRMWVLSLIVCITAACNHLSPLYTAYSPQHRCISSETLQYHPTLSSGEILETNKTDYNFKLLSQDNSTSKCKIPNDDSKCDKWVYDSSVFMDTIVTEWDLVCERLALLPTVSSSYMAGVVVFNGAGGILSDSIGRRKTILIFSAIHVLFSFLTSISQSYLMFVGVRFFVGGCIHSVWAAMFIIAMETVCEPMRTSTGAVFSLGWNVGSLIMTFLAYLLRSWWKLQLAFAFFSLLLSSYYFLVPESPRWLLENGRSKEAKAVLLKIAQVNSTNIDETKFHVHFEELERRILNEEERKDNGNNKTNSKLKDVLDLFSNVLTNKEYLFRLILMIPPWLAVGCSAYGIHFSAKFVNFDIFTVAAIKEAAVFAIILLIVPFFKRGKRVPSVLSIYLVSGTLALIFYFIPSGQVALQVTVFVLCQGFMVGVFYMIGTYTQDVFSTDIRGTTFNFLDCMSKLGTVFAPFIVDIGGEKNHGLPPAIFGCMMILSSLTLLFTPETKGLPLTQSYKDMKLNSFTKTSIIGKFYHKFCKKL